MDDEERKKKLEAGKERLAAFRKKKAKKKKRPIGDVASGGDVDIHIGVDGNSADISSSSDIQSLTEDSDQLSFDDCSGDEWSGEESEMHSVVYYQAKLRDVHQRVAELEEMVEGKQLALDRLVGENNTLKSQQIGVEQTQVELNNRLISLEVDGKKTKSGFTEKGQLRDLQMALGQRDAIIQQLTVRLRATTEKVIPDCSAETENLAKQLGVLQRQLLEAGDALRGQMNHHTMSSQALQEAKAEIMLLQRNIKKKDEILAQLKQNLTLKTEEVFNLGNTCKDLQMHEADVQKELLSVKDEKNVLTMKLQDQSDIDNLRIELEKIESDYASIKSEMSMVKMRNAELEALCVEKADVHDRFGDLKSQMETVAAENINLVSEVSSLKSSMVELELSCSEFQEEIQQKQSENDRMRNKINDQQGEIVDLRAQLEMLEDENIMTSSEVVKQMVESREEAFASELKAKMDDILALQEEHQRYKDTIEKLNEEIKILKCVHQSESEMDIVIKIDSSTITDSRDIECSQELDMPDSFNMMQYLDPEQDALQHHNLGVRQASVGDSAVVMLQTQCNNNVGEQIEISNDTRADQSSNALSNGHVMSAEEIAERDSNDDITLQLCNKTLSEEVQNLKSELMMVRTELDAKQLTLEELQSQNDYFKSQIENLSRLQEEFNQLESDHALQKSLHNEDRNSLHILEEELTTLKAGTKELQSENSKLSLEKIDLENTVQTLSTEKHSLEENISTLNTDVERLTSELQCLTLKLQSNQDHHESEYNKLEEESRRLREENQKLLSSKEDMQNHQKEQLDSSATDISALKKELADAKADLEKVILEEQRLTEEMQMKIETSLSQIQCLTAELDQARQEMQRTVIEEQQQKSSVQVEFVDLSKEITKLREEVTKSEALVLTEQQLRDQCQTQNDDLSNKISMLCIELEQASATIQNLERDKTSLEDDLTKATADVEKVNFEAESLKTNFEIQNQHLIEEIKVYEDLLKQMKADYEKAKTKEQESRDALQMQYDLSQEEVTKLQTEVDHARVNAEQLADDKTFVVETFEARLCESSAEIEQLKRELSQSRIEFDDLQGRFATMQEEYQQCQLQTQEDIDSLEKRLELAHNETEQIVTLNAQKQASLEASLATAVEELENLKTDETKTKSAFESQLLGSVQELAKTQENLKDLQTRFDYMQSSYFKESKTRVEVEQQTENLSGEVRNLQSILDVSQAEVSSLQTQLDALNERVRSEQSSREEIQNQYDVLTDDLNLTIIEKDELQCVIKNNRDYIKRIVESLCDNVDNENINRFDYGLRVLEDNMTRMKLEIERLIILVEDKNSSIAEMESVAAKKNEDMEIMSEYTNTLKTELTEIKTCLEEKAEEVTNMDMEINSLQNNNDSLQKEKEILKINFDSCLEEMQSKIAEQESDIKNLKSQLVENTKNSDSDNDIKVAYETHVSILEEKLEKTEAELDEIKLQFNSALDDKQNLLTTAETQIAELSDTYNGLVNENSQLKEQMEKASEIFQKENSHLQKIHETQIAELDDNCRTLEGNVSRLQSQMSEQARTLEQQKKALEISYDNQLADIEDRCRILDMENGKLKHHMEEMANDHKQEKEHLLKVFESQVIELEDRCRENDMKYGTCQQKLEEQLSDSEHHRHQLEQSLQELDDRCKELEQSRSLVQDRLADAIENAQQEKSILEKTIAKEKENNHKLQCKLQNFRERQEQLRICDSSSMLSEAGLKTDISPNDVEHETVIDGSYDTSTKISPNSFPISDSHAPNVSEGEQPHPEISSCVSDMVQTEEIVNKLEDKIKLLSKENTRLIALLGTEKATQSIETQTLARRASYPGNEDMLDLKSTICGLQMQVESLSRENDTITTDLQNERETIIGASQTIEELKEGLRSARTVFDQMKVDHQNELDLNKEESNQVILELREKLASWEMELIIRRELVECSPKEETTSETTGQTNQFKIDETANSESSESEREGSSFRTLESDCRNSTPDVEKLVQLVANYEQKVGNLSLELSRLQSEYQTSKNMHEAEVADLKRRLADNNEVNLIQDSSVASSFKPECDIPQASLSVLPLSSIQSQTKSSTNLSPMSGEFQPETGGAFEPETPSPEIDFNQNMFHLESKLHPKDLSSDDHLSFSENFDMGVEPVVRPKKSTLLVHMNNEPIERIHMGTQTNLGELRLGRFTTEEEVCNKFGGDSLSIISVVNEGFEPEETSSVVAETSLISTLSLTKPIHFDENVIKPDASTQTESPDVSEFDESSPHDISKDTELLRRQLNHEKDLLEENYVKQLRMQEIEITQKFDAEKEQLRKELDQHLHKKMSAINIEKQQQFIKALRKVRKQLEARHQKEIDSMRQHALGTSTNQNPDTEPDEIVNQLRKENQELAEARDALLKQVDMTQTQHTQLQDELDSVLSEKDTKSPQNLQDMSKLEDDTVSASRRFPSNSEQFLEELEKLSQQSWQDVPLEWELSMSSEEGVFDKELDSSGPCTKYECIDLKQKYNHLVELFNKFQGTYDSAFVEEPQVDIHPVTDGGKRVNRSRICDEETESQERHPRTEDEPLNVNIASRQDPLGTTENDFMDGDFRQRILQLESENILLEKKVSDQLEVFSSEKQNLKQKCEALQISLDHTSLSGREMEQELIKQNDVLQQSVSQLKKQVDQKSPGSSTASENLDDDQKMQVQYLTRVLETKEVLIEQLQNSLLVIMSNQESREEAMRNRLIPIESVGEESYLVLGLGSSDMPVEGTELDRVEHIIPGNVPKTILKPCPSEKPQLNELRQNSSPKQTENVYQTDNVLIDQSFSVSDDNSFSDLNTQHTDLIEELHNIQQKHHEIKIIHAEEKALLQEELEREKLTVQLFQSKTGCKTQDLFSSEMVELRRELFVLREFNKVLSFENKCFYDRMRDQERLVLYLKEEMDKDDASSADWQNTFGRQLLLLQKQREQLLQQIENGQSKQNHLASLLGEKTVLEETLRKEKQILLEKLVQFEDLQHQLSQRGIHFEHFIGEQRRLEQLLLLKDENEKQLMRQKRLLQEELFEIEAKLGEREGILEEEKMRLLREVKEKNVTIKKLESLNIGGSSGDGLELRFSSGRARRSSTGRLEGHLPTIQLGGSWCTGEPSYEEAIEILRNKLKMEHEVKEAKLVESHASQMASFWNEQTKKLESLKNQYEAQMDALRQELAALKEQKQQNYLLLQDHHKEAVEKLRDEVGNDETKKRLDTVLNQLQQIYAAKIDQIETEHKEDIFLQVQAMRLSAEQVYNVQLELFQLDVEEKHAAHIDSLNKQHKEEMNRLEQELSKKDSNVLSEFEKVDGKVSEKYQQLIEKISAELDSLVVKGFQGDNTESNDIRVLLDKQKEDIDHLRSQLLSDVEHEAQTQQLQQLQKEMQFLQKQYEEQVSIFQTQIQHYTEKDSQTEEMQKNQQNELDDLRAYYEKHVRDMEKSFEEEISSLQAKYEENMSKLHIDAIQGSESKDIKDSEDKSYSTELSVVREYVHRTTNLTVISDSDESMTETSKQHNIDGLETKISGLEDIIREREKQIGDLEGMLEEEKDRTSQSVKEMKLVKDRLNESEQLVDVLRQDISSKELVITELQEKTDTASDNEKITELEQKLCDSIKQEKDLQVQIENLVHRHKEDLDALRQDLEHETKIEIETMQSEFKVQMEIELKRQAAEIERSVPSRESIVESRQHFVEGEVTQSSDSTNGSVNNESNQTNGANVCETSDSVICDKEKDFTDLRKEYTDKIDSLTQELAVMTAEKDCLSKKHQSDIENMQLKLTRAQEKYEKLMQDIENGECTKVEDIIRDKIDNELELAKNLMQQEFDETLESERKRFMECHRKMMDDFMTDRAKEAEELQQKHDNDMKQQREALQEYEEKLKQLESVQSEELQKLQEVTPAVLDSQTVHVQTDCTDDDDSVEEKILQLQEQHEKILIKSKQEYEEKSQELQTSQDDALSAAALDTEKIKSELEAAHQQELHDLEQQLQEKHRKEMKNLEKQYQREFEEIGEQTSVEVTQTQSLTSSQLEHAEELREVSEVVLPVYTTSLLQRVELNSTLGSDMSGNEAQLLKSSGHDESTSEPEEDHHTPCGTPDELMVTRSFADVVRGGSQSDVDEMDKNEKIEKLEATVKELTERLHQYDMEEEVLIGRRQREEEADNNLVSMLKSDLERISAERNAVQRTNDHLLQTLSDSVKACVLVEDRINRNLTKILTQSGSQHPPDQRPRTGSWRTNFENDQDLSRDGRRDLAAGRASSPNEQGDGSGSQDSSTLAETSILSVATDEGLDLSQRFTDSIFTGPELEPEGEEIVTDARLRLQESVNKLLNMIEQTTQQLHDTKQTQQELVDTLALRSQELEAQLHRCEELEERLGSEINAKEYLALELSKAEGLISGYSSEQEILQQQIDDLEEKRQAMAQDLELTRNRLHGLQKSQDEVEQMRGRVERQQAILQENIGQENQDMASCEQSEAVPGDDDPALLTEVNNLNLEKHKLEEHTQHQLYNYKVRVQDLESVSEERERHHEDQLEQSRQEIEDLRMKLDKVERQLKANKQFLDEQASEREQEREDFLKDIDKLQHQLHDKAKQGNTEGRLQMEVQDLSDQLQNRIDNQSEILRRAERLQKDLQDKDLAAQELKEWVGQLEQNLEDKEVVEVQLKQKIERLESQIVHQPESELLEQSLTLSAEFDQFGSPNILSPVRRSPAQRIMTLEDELKKYKKTEEDLMLEKDALQRTAQEQLLQISALRNQLDDMRHYGSEVNGSHGTHAAELREQLQSARDVLEKKEQEVSVMEEEVEQLKKLLSDRETEINKLLSKLESETHPASPTENIEMLRTLEHENETLKSKIDGLQEHSDGSNILSELAESLLKEKDSEIDDLNEEINQLQVALEAKQTIDEDTEDIENLKAQLVLKDDSIAELQSTIHNLTGDQFSGDVSLTEVDRRLLSVSLTGKATLQQELEDSVSKLKIQEDKDTQTEEKDEPDVSSLPVEIEELKARLSQAEISKEELTKLLQAAEEERNDVQAQLAEKEREAIVLQEDIDQKHLNAEQMTIQIDSLQEEITSLTSFQNELQQDFDIVQTMLENKQREMDSLSQEITDSVPPPSLSNAEIEQCQKEISELRKSVADKVNIIEEKEEELYELNEKLELQDSLSSELSNVRKVLEETEQSLGQERQLREQLLKQYEELQEQNVNKTESEKENQQIKLADTESKLRDMETKLAETEEHLKETMESLSEKEEIIKEKEILELLQKVDEDRQEDIQQKHDMDELDQKNIIEELRSQISQLEQKLQEKSELLQSLESEKDTESTLLKSVSNLQNKLQIQEALCDQYATEQIELNSKIKLKEERIEQLCKEQVDVVADLEEKLQAKQQEYLLLEYDLQETQTQMQLETQRLEEDIVRMKKSQESVDESDVLKQEDKIESLNFELADVSRHLREAQDRVDQTSVMLAEREAQITQLQAEVLVASNSAQTLASDLTSEMGESKEDVSQLETSVAEKDEEITTLKSSLSATEQELTTKSEQLRRLQDNHKTLTEELSQAKQQSLSQSAPRELSDFHSDIRLARSESEPTLDTWRRSSSEFMSRLNQIEALTLQQKMELAEKNRQLGIVREQMELWLAKGQQGQGDVKTLILKLTTELKNVSEPSTEPAPVEKERDLRLSEREFESAERTLQLQQSEINELRDSNENLRQEWSARDVVASRSEQQILHLKSKLRKAKSTLAEMRNQSSNNIYLQSDRNESGDYHRVSTLVDVDVESLQRELEDCKRELKILKSTAPMSTQDFVKKIQNLRTELSEEHKEHIRDIQHQHVENLEAKLTSLQLKHDDELQHLQQQHQLKLEQAVAMQKQELEKQHKSEINALLIENQRDMDRLRNDYVVHDDASVVERCDRLRTEVSSTEQLDGRLQNRLSGVGLDAIVQNDSDISLTESSSMEFLPDENISTKLQAIMTKVHKHGLNILTLSEMQYLQRHMSPEQIGANIDVQALTESWERERQAYMSTINTLKELLSKVKSSDRSTDVTKDWRGDLLTMLCKLFTKERELLLAELHTYIASHTEADNSTIIGKLEQRIQDQESLHRSAIDQVFHTDRQSLLWEIEELRSTSSQARMEKHEQQQKLSEQYSAQEEESLKKERQLQRQIQVLEFKIQQEKVIEDDLRKSLEMENKRVTELSNQMAKEKSQSLDFQSEITSLQINLSKARDALEREQSRFTSVTDALEDGREKNGHLVELLDAEKRKCLLLESQVADLRSHNKDYLEKESRFVEQLRSELSKEQERRLDSVRHAEMEKAAKTTAQQELEIERRRIRSIQNDYDSLLAQLKSSLETERLKCDELSGNLEREHQQITQLQTLLEAERSARQEMSHQGQSSMDNYLQELQDSKTLVEDLKRALTREKQNSSSLSDMLDMERASTQHDIEEERNAARKLKRDIDTVQMEKLELKRHFDLERESSRAIQMQVEELQADLKAMKQRENEIKKQASAEHKQEKRRQRELEREKDELNIKLHEQELESHRLKERLSDTEMEVDQSRDREQRSRIELERLRHEFERNRLLKSPRTPVVTEMAPPSTPDVRVQYVGSPSVTMDTLKSLQQRLEYISIRIQEDFQASPQLQQDLTSILSEITSLQHGHSDQIGSTGVGDSVIEHTLQHNEDLTKFLAQVCKEKEELRVHQNELEDELVTYRRKERQDQITQENSGQSEENFMHDRVMWANERLSLQMNLDSAEHEIEHLQGELRYLRNEQNTVHLVDTDREKMQRLYGRLLRSESFRKALVYQKRYLLLLLGGYQDCEQETLMLIAQIGGYPSTVDLQRRQRHARMFMVFRSAARVVIAIWRMRYMVKKWRRATRVGSPVVGGRINQQFGYVATNSSYSPPRPSSSPLPLGSPRNPVAEAESLHRVNVSPPRPSYHTAALQNGDISHSALSTDYSSSRRRLYTTPPTKDPSLRPSSAVPASSSARRRLLHDLENPPSNDLDLPHAQAEDESPNDEFIQRLENLQNRLGSFVTSSKTRHSYSRHSSWR